MIGRYTNGSWFTAYKYGEVNISGSIFYYVRWYPSTASGTMYINGSYIQLSSYSGYFSSLYWDGNLTGPASSGTGIYDHLPAISSPDIYSIETNVYSVGPDGVKCPNLTYASFSNCRTIGGYAFGNCSGSLVSVYAPVCETVGSMAFYNCSKLRYLDIQNCDRIERNGFYGCSSLSTLSVPECSYIGVSAFVNCSSLKYVYAPECLRVESHAFEQCQNLYSVTLTNCSYIGDYAFVAIDALGGYSSMYSLNLPACKYIGSSAFTYIDIKELHLSVCEHIGAGNFYHAGLSLFLYSNSVCICDGFPQTDFGLMYVYVPSSLVSDYKNTSPWTRLGNYILPLPS